MSLVKQSGATGVRADYLDAIEETAQEQWGLRARITDDRARLMILHGGLPPFPGWFPIGMGGAAGFWIDWQDAGGKSRATGGAVVYAHEPASLAEFVNAGGMDAEGHEIRLREEAEARAEHIGGLTAFSGNLIVWRQADRKTSLSRWLTEITPLMNKAIAMEIYDVDTFVTFVRDQQLNHLGPRYRLPVLTPGVVWSRRFQPDTHLHLGVQTPSQASEQMGGILCSVQPKLPDRRHTAA